MCQVVTIISGTQGAHYCLRKYLKLGSLQTTEIYFSQSESLEFKVLPDLLSGKGWFPVDIGTFLLGHHTATLLGLFFL
jgi:hypothetical protein